MLCDLVRVTTADGVRLDGAWLPSPNNAAPATAVSSALCLHGVGSSFYGSNLFENLCPMFHALGIGVLLVNTRGHDTAFASSTITGRRFFGAAYECVDECRLDIAAWSEWLAKQGTSRMLLAGHSLGAIKSVYCAAYQPPANLAALLALSPPRLSYSAFMNGLDSAPFFQAMTQAKEHVEASRGDTLMKVAAPFPMMITAAGYVEKYGPAERYNLLKFVREVRCPTLFSYGGQELEQGGIAFAGMPDALRGLMSAEQSLDVVTIPDADHNYTRTHQSLSDAVRAWLMRISQ